MHSCLNGEYTLVSYLRQQNRQLAKQCRATEGRSNVRTCGQKFLLKNLCMSAEPTDIVVCDLTDKAEDSRYCWYICL